MSKIAPLQPSLPLTLARERESAGAAKREAARHRKNFFVDALETANEARHRNVARVTSAFAVKDKLPALGVGDTLTVSASGTVMLGFLGALSGSLTVLRSAEDQYIVSTSLSGATGLSLFGGSLVGAGASVDFAFSSAAEARQALEALVPGGAHPDVDFKGHLRAINLNTNLTAALDAHFGAVVTAGASAALVGSAAWAIVFRDGHAFLQRTVGLTGELAARAAADVIPGATLGDTEQVRAALTASAGIVSSLPLPEEFTPATAARAVAFVSDLTGLSDSTLGAHNFVALTWMASTARLGNDRGTAYGMISGDVSLTEAITAGSRALRGDVAGAREALGGVIEGGYRFEDRGVDQQLDLGFSAAGVSVHFQNEVRDVETTPAGADT